MVGSNEVSAFHSYSFALSGPGTTLTLPSGVGAQLQLRPLKSGGDDVDDFAMGAVGPR